MEKLSKTKLEIEELVLAEMRTFADCEDVVGVAVIPVSDYDDTATWTISRFNPGKADIEACDHALQCIVPRFQRFYDIVQKH